MTAHPIIVWTRQDPYLWTGRADDMPIGTIEHGARFNYIDVQGAEHHGFRTLEAAQEAARALLQD